MEVKRWWRKKPDRFARIRASKELERLANICEGQERDVLRLTSQVLEYGEKFDELAQTNNEFVSSGALLRRQLDQMNADYQMLLIQGRERLRAIRLLTASDNDA